MDDFTNQPTTEAQPFNIESRADMESLFVAVATGNVDFFKDLEDADARRAENNVRIVPIAMTWE